MAGPLELFALAQAGSFALQIAQIIELGSPNAAGTHYINMIDDASVHGEDALHAVPKADLPDGDALAHGHAVTRNHHALEGLKTLFIAFLDLHMDFDRVAGAEIGKRLFPLVLIDVLGQQRILHGKNLSVTYQSTPQRTVGWASWRVC